MLIFVIILANISSFSQSSEAQFDQNQEKTFPKSEISEKVNPLIQNWQSAIDQESFAINNNLIFSDGKISVYIYLDSPESISNLPLSIDVTSSAENIAVAFMDSRQITEVSQLDFVQRIDLPIRSTSPPIPVSDDVFSQNEETGFVNYVIVIVAAILILIIVFSIKRKLSQKVLNVKK